MLIIPPNAIAPSPLVRPPELTVFGGAVAAGAGREPARAGAGLTRSQHLDAEFEFAGECVGEGETPLVVARPAVVAKTQLRERREQVEALFRLIKRLPVEHRQVINLWYQDHSFEEIGRLMGRSTNAARMLWMRAIEGVHKLAEAV